mmetsp:Transcript_40018/g.113463  ORF Transcript_40018/g.113463 Transcript_40018/m.113463 type:complete len:191 (+) Transcript_40018:91-663(+)
MSFAASLCQISVSAKERFELDMDQWAAVAVDKFKAACQQLAEAEGAEEASTQTADFSNATFMSKAFSSPGDVADAVTKCLQTRLDELGFASCSAILHPRYCGPYNNVQTNKFFWVLTASWAGVQTEEPKEQFAPTGLSAGCPVCLETTAVVALIPCGHAVCRKCAVRFVKAKCPSCRQHVTGMTKGIFIG